MTRRIQKIVELMPNCQTLLDVGCDHGYIPYLAKIKGKCQNIIISDVSRPSLKKAEDLLTKNGIPFRSYHTDGIHGIDEEYDLLSVCGMGGYEILSIIENARVKRLIVQPMKNVNHVRRELSKRGYKIIEDVLVESEDKFYDIIYCEFKGGIQNISDIQAEFGLSDMNNPDFSKYITERRKKIGDILSGKLPLNRESELKAQLSMIEKTYF